jgi:hypothetical protein
MNEQQTKKNLEEENIPLSILRRKMYIKNKIIQANAILLNTINVKITKSKSKKRVRFNLASDV